MKSWQVHKSRAYVPDDHAPAGSTQYSAVFVPAGPAQHEPFCTVLLHQLNEDIAASIEQFSRPTRRLDSLLRQKLVPTRWFAGRYRIIVIWNRQPGRLPVCATLSRRASLPRLHQEEEPKCALVI